MTNSSKTTPSDPVELTMYRSIAGEWFVVPACLLPSIGVTRRFGPLVRVQDLTLAAESARAIQWSAALEHTGFHQLTASEAEQLVAFGSGEAS